MQDSYNLSSLVVVRRSPAKLPSVKRNIVRAFGVLLLAGTVGATVYVAVNDPSDAIARGEVGVDPAPLPPPIDHLNSTTEALPDLLASSVPNGVNPTEGLDALGNPVSPVGDAGLVGGQAPIIPDSSDTPEAVPDNANIQPGVITINGRPITTVRAASPLVKAPLPGLHRTSPFGQIPVIANDGRKAVTSYARPFAPTPGKTSVSVVVGGLGIDPAVTRRAIYELPPEVTLSFAAHTTNLQSYIDQARAQGHEVMLEIPMESADFNPAETGADHALRVNATPARNIRNLDWLLARGRGYFAVTNYNGDLFLRRSDMLVPVLTKLSDSGLGFVFDGSIAAPTLGGLSEGSGLPFQTAYNLIDTQNDPVTIEIELLRLEQEAMSSRTPIGVGFAFNNTIDQILTWSNSLNEKNLELAPASHSLNKG